jgi:rRNA pseudouridine-1189 N-methylase Emg1 (Nep1/Mra1 family)
MKSNLLKNSRIFINNNRNKLINEINRAIDNHLIEASNQVFSIMKKSKKKTTALVISILTNVALILTLLIVIF